MYIPLETFTNFKKTDWNKFRNICEHQFSQIPLPVNAFARARDIFGR